MKNVLILGADTGGTILANTLVRKLDSKKWQVTVIDSNNEHVSQPAQRCGTHLH